LYAWGCLQEVACLVDSLDVSTWIEWLREWCWLISHSHNGNTHHTHLIDWFFPRRECAFPMTRRQWVLLASSWSVEPWRSLN
jgi:hypothetical protein